MAEQLREHGFYFNEQQRIPRRRSAAYPQGGYPTTNAPASGKRQTEEDNEILDEGHDPFRLPSSSRRYNLPATKREYMIPLSDGTTLYVTEQKLVTMGRNYQNAAQEVPAGTIAQKRTPRPNANRATPPDVIEVPLGSHTQTEPVYAPTWGERIRGFLGKALLVLGIGLIIMIVGYIVLNIVGNWWQVQQDDWHYGRPRTFQIDYNVGHGTDQQPLSHFLAQNLNRHIIVIEIPGDDPSKSTVYIGPALIGPGEDLTPVTLSFEGGTPGHPNLVIHVADSRYIFLNQKVNGVWKFVAAPNQ